MKLLLYVVRQVLLWSSIGALLVFVFIDWNRPTWFDWFLALGFVGSVGYSFYKLLVCLMYGREIEKKLVSLTLPEKATVCFSTQGYKSGKVVLFSHNANLRALSGTISLKDAKGQIIEQLALNQPSDVQNPIAAGRSIRINGGGKSGSIDYLRYLSFRNLSDSDDTVQLDFNLDWSASRKKYSINKLPRSTIFEVIMRARKLLPDQQPSPVMQS